MRLRSIVVPESPRAPEPVGEPAFDLGQLRLRRSIQIAARGLKHGAASLERAARGHRNRRRARLRQEFTQCGFLRGMHPQTCGFSGCQLFRALP